MERIEERRIEKVKRVVVLEDYQEHDEMCIMCGDEPLQYIDEDKAEICPFCYDHGN
jgi:hypothetical protein